MHLPGPPCPGDGGLPHGDRVAWFRAELPAGMIEVAPYRRGVAQEMAPGGISDAGPSGEAGIAEMRAGRGRVRACPPDRREPGGGGAGRPVPEELMAVGTDQATVVVTGLGATPPLGGDVASTWQALLAGRSGVRPLAADFGGDLPVRIGAPAAVGPAGVLDRVQVRRLDRCEQFAIVAAREAWADAGPPDAEPERIGVAVSSGIGGIASTLDAYDTLNSKGWQRLSPYTVPMLMPNGSAGWISIELGARAGVHTTVSACASGAESIAYGIDMIRSGRADVVMAGGTEAAILRLNIAAFAAMRALSTRNDEPQRASRPFDKGRDGFLLGEGAAMLVLESAEHAARRGARVYAVAAGFGYSSDAHHIAQPAPDGKGLVRVMQNALADRTFTQLGAEPDQLRLLVGKRAFRFPQRARFVFKLLLGDAQLIA